MNGMRLVECIFKFLLKLFPIKMQSCAALHPKSTNSTELIKLFKHRTTYKADSMKICESADLCISKVIGKTNR